jgi:agmatine deiminase
MAIRLPAEWEKQDGVLLSWPHRQTDWLPALKRVIPVFASIAAQISRFEKVVIVSPEPDQARTVLERTDADRENIFYYKIPTNDTWARDFGAITVLKDGKPLLLDFTFNAWGLKFAADLDNRITSRLFQSGAFSKKTRLTVPGLVLEGGSIESDGKGTVLTTENCLLSPNRNPHLDKNSIERELKKHLGAKRVLWLASGRLEGDDTDAHIDTLARFCPDDTIAYVGCEDKKEIHYDPLRQMRTELENSGHFPESRTGWPLYLSPKQDIIKAGDFRRPTPISWY